MLVFGYFLLSLEPHVAIGRPTDPLVTKALQWHICNLQLLAEGLWSGVAISAVPSGLRLLFFIWEELSLHLPWKANVYEQSGLKQRNQVQGQIKSTAVIRKLRTVILVLTHSRRSELIGSRLDPHMDLETPELWEFASGVLSIGWKLWKN